MSINQVQFQRGLSMAEFMERYGTEEKCHAALVASRWPDGFRCPRCRDERHSTFVREGRNYWQCYRCRHQTTVTAGTIFDATKLPLTCWFVAMHLMTQAKNNVSALELKRHLGVRYKSAWLMKVWTRLRNKAGLPHLRLHDLRHSYASFLVNSGRTLYEVQQILGHSDAKVTERYAHLSSKTLQEAAKPPASSSRAPVPKRRSRASRDGSPGVRSGLPAANLPEKHTLRAAGAFFRGRDYCPHPDAGAGRYGPRIARHALPATTPLSCHAR